MRRLGAHGASVAHNPAATCGWATAWPMRRHAAAGVNLAIGTDATTCNDNLNMYQTLHFAAVASHARGPIRRAGSPRRRSFAAATIGSARALGFEQIGRIAPGYAADIVFLDLDAPTLIPLNEPMIQVVMGEDGTSVADVMVGGRSSCGPRLLTVDLPALAARAGGTACRASTRGAWRAAGDSMRSRRSCATSARPWQDRVAHQPMVRLRLRAAKMHDHASNPAFRSRPDVW